MLYLPFGDDARLLHGVFGFFFQASSYRMFGRLEMVLDLIMLLLLQTLFIKWFLTLSYVVVLSILNHLS